MTHEVARHAEFKWAQTTIDVDAVFETWVLIQSRLVLNSCKCNGSEANSIADIRSPSIQLECAKVQKTTHLTRWVVLKTMREVVFFCAS